MTSKTKNSFLSIPFTILLLSSGFVGLATAGEPVHTDWAAIFSSDGSLLDQVDANGVPDYQDLYGGFEAVHIKDNISDSLAIDMSARTGPEALADDLVYNGMVAAPNAIGNTHIMATRDASKSYPLSLSAEDPEQKEGQAEGEGECEDVQCLQDEHLIGQGGDE